MQNLITPLARVRGIGSGKHGAASWIALRVSGIALVPLGLWFVYSVVLLAGSPRSTIAYWFTSPFHTLGVILLLGATFHHLYLGMKEVVEDYVHCSVGKPALLICIKLASLAGFALGALSAITLHLSAPL